MTNKQATTGSQDSRLDWIEPTAIYLQVSETAANPTLPGGDGGAVPDCTSS